MGGWGLLCGNLLCVCVCVCVCACVCTQVSKLQQAVEASNRDLTRQIEVEQAARYPPTPPHTCMKHTCSEIQNV